MAGEDGEAGAVVAVGEGNAGITGNGKGGRDAGDDFKGNFGGSEGGLIGRSRQRKLLQETAASLRRCVEVVGQGEELAAEELRMAAHSLGQLLGRVDVEDILDVIFREFCVGK